MEFFNDLGKKFSHAARSVQERTREGVESTKLAMDIRAARSELENRFAALGRAYYEHTANAGPEVDEALIRAVRESIAQIESMSAQRDRARQLTRCSSCGSAQPESARYCSNCGRPMPEAAPQIEDAPADDVQYCEQCGAMREGSVRYCPVCGHSFIPSDNPPALEAPASLSVPAPEEPADTNAE